MEKLDKVIAALEQCHRDIKYRDCDVCEYASSGSECERCLMEDALELLKEYDELETAHSKLFLRYKEIDYELVDTRRRCSDFERKVIHARKERDDARREVLRLEAQLFELRQRPNDWGEYPPEFPREGM